MRLSSQGWKVTKIAAYFGCTESTVRATLHRFIQEGIKGLEDKPRSGRRRKWQTSDLEYLEQFLDQDQRTYNISQLVEKLKTSRQVELSAKRLKQLLKERVYLHSSV